MSLSFSPRLLLTPPGCGHCTGRRPYVLWLRRPVLFSTANTGGRLNFGGIKCRWSTPSLQPRKQSSGRLSKCFRSLSYAVTHRADSNERSLKCLTNVLKGFSK
jgi:hypothetical protein